MIPCVRVGIRFASNQLCVCLFVSEMLVVPQPINVRVLTSWPIIAFGSIPALMRHFLSRRLLFSVISNHHAEVRSRKRALGWWILPKNAHQNFQEEYDTEQFLCVIVQSTQSAKHVKCSTCFFSSWDFSVTHGRIYAIKWCMSLKHHINKEKTIEVCWRFPILWVLRWYLHNVWT